MPELKVLTGSQKGQVFLLRPPGPYRLGREADAEFPIFDKRVSRSHFRIDFTDEGYRLQDLKSRTGTFLNDHRLENGILKGGDKIQIGKTVIAFELDHPEDSLLGRELGGSRIIERVGRGGMGTVYRALQVSLDRVVALKVLPEELARDRDFTRLFIQEARAAGELSHPNIVRVYDVNMLNGTLYYSMEFMALGSVEDLLRREGPLSVRRAMAIALEAARGLEYAERHGVVHRDIKPANLMIQEKGLVKIGDLGIATRASRDRGSERGRGITGSPHYMAPEQALGREVDTRADIYSLGASLHEMLAGSPPFRGKTLKEILYAHIQEAPPDLRAFRPDVPETLAKLVVSMLAKDPAGRPASATELSSMLEGIYAAGASSGAGSGPDRPSVAGRVIRLLAGLALAFILGVGIAFMLRQMRSEHHDRNRWLFRVRSAIEEGREALRAGDVEAAMRKSRSIKNTPGTPDDWETLAPELKAFEKAIQNASKKTEKEGG